MNVMDEKLCQKKISVHVYIVLFNSLDLIVDKRFCLTSMDDDRQFENKTFDSVGKTPASTLAKKRVKSTFVYYYVDASRMVVSDVTFFKHLKNIGSLHKKYVKTLRYLIVSYTRMKGQMITCLFLLTLLFLGSLIQLLFCT